MHWEVLLPLLFFGRGCVEFILFLPFLCNRIHQWNQWLRVFFVGRFLTINSSYTERCYDYLLLVEWVLVVLSFNLSICPFHPNCQIYYSKIIHNILFTYPFFCHLAQDPIYQVSYLVMQSKSFFKYLIHFS